MTEALYFEDLPVGRRFVTPEATVDEALLAPYWRNVGAGEGVPPLAVAAISMRLLLQSAFQAVGGTLGAGVQGLSWPMPARPGDVLRVEIEVTEARRSKTRPDRGLVTTRNRTLTRAGEVVQEASPTIIIPARTAA